MIVLPSKTKSDTTWQNEFAFDNEAKTPIKDLYFALLQSSPSCKTKNEALNFIENLLIDHTNQGCELPEDFNDLSEWMAAQLKKTGEDYQSYLLQRELGLPRRFFPTKSHALIFLQHIEPTKRVDGSWLYSLLNYWQDPRASKLIHTYLDELGNGHVNQNHAIIFQKLLTSEGVHIPPDLPDEYYLQGCIQQALGWMDRDYLPEIIGFNLGYEQLPLHLLITAYELNELGIDPYYFSLHITVDNAATGHAQQAIQTLFDFMPLRNQPAFYRRVCDGYRLNQLGLSTLDVIQAIDLEHAVLQLFTHKAQIGQYAHSNYCRLEGKTINEWLSDPSLVAQFLDILENKGWIKKNAPVENSRFWHAISDEKAPMFGVFTKAEQQIIRDWIEGELSHQHKFERAESFRLMHSQHDSKLKINQVTPDSSMMLNDSDLIFLQHQLKMNQETNAQIKLLQPYLCAALHVLPVGLWATQEFKKILD